MYLNLIVRDFLCSVLKLFHKDRIVRSMKLTRAKLTETLRRIADGKTTYQTRKVAKISVRRVLSSEGGI